MILPVSMKRAIHCYVASLRRCVNKKWLPNCTATQHGEEAKRKSQATAQRRNVKANALWVMIGVAILNRGRQAFLKLVCPFETQPPSPHLNHYLPSMSLTPEKNDGVFYVGHSR